MKKWTLKMYFFKMEVVFGKNLLNAGIIEPVSGHRKYKSGIDGLGVVDLRHLK